MNLFLFIWSLLNYIRSSVAIRVVAGDEIID